MPGSGRQRIYCVSFAGTRVSRHRLWASDLSHHVASCLVSSLAARLPAAKLSYTYHKDARVHCRVVSKMCRRSRQRLHLSLCRAIAFAPGYRFGEVLCSSRDIQTLASGAIVPAVNQRGQHGTNNLYKTRIVTFRWSGIFRKPQFDRCKRGPKIRV